MLLDTRSMSFDMREIDNRRFMFSPQTGELILGRQYRSGQLYKSHAEEHFDSGAKAPFDSFIRGWIGTGRDYPDGVIHFAPNIGTDNITAFDNAFSTLQMFSENGAAGDTVVRGFGRKWEQPLKDIITPTKERSKTVSEQEKNYSSYDFDRLEVAKKLVIERSIYFESEKADISALTGLSLAELTRLRQESAAAEQAVFDRLKTEAAAWEQQAGNTRFLEKAIEYVQTPPVKHTSNKWEKTDYEWQLRSNAVYQMRYHVYENTRYDRQAQKSVPYSWSLTWSVRTNGPNHEQNVKIAGQERKTFSDKAAMEKYLAGRIKAYDRLFTEPAPPVPKEYAEPFKVNGLLLPGYVIEGEPPQHTAPQQAAQPTRPDPEKVEMDAAAMQAAPLTVEPPQPQPVIPINLTAEKPAEKLKEITDRLEQGITELFDSERYKEYLRVMSKFHNYSFNNTLLIAMQKPDASLIAGFTAWKNQFQRNVKKGEKGIKIIAPSPFKIKQETEKIDPQTQKPVIGRDGKPVTEEKEITIPAYKVVSVFDVSQTEGKELPDIAVDALTGDVEQYSDFFAALEKTSPVPIGFEKIEGGAHGYYHLEDKRIALDEGMSELQTLKTAIHEIAHAKLHDIDLNAPKDEQQPRVDRRTREVEAESVAYTVCQHYGLDTSDYSFGYVAGWSSGRELAELKSSLETIRSAAADIINSIDGHIAQIQKEQTAEQEQPTQEAEPDKDTFSIYQLKRSDETRDLRFEPYDRLTATGHAVDPANYDLIYSAPLAPGTSLEAIFTRFNIDHPKDFKGHSLSVSDVVVLHQNGQDTAHYVDSIGFRQTPEFLQPQNYLKHVEDIVEQNDNNFDGIINNTPQTPTVGELEQKAKAGEPISLIDLADAIHADKERGKEEKPSIRAQLRAAKEQTAQRKAQRSKTQDLERI
ncbi:ssDNA-binding domain-containing protein [Oscillospiraceae bacterium CLA-AA-H272]|uniref:SsDNA-binding domain-containing protein n=1 Tax=Brotocaccenecus cirricatena TaxID=3064195 RepID=A0AAE3ACQ7_9FIRM|nr:YodL domain-containing protein [Brotocaccenecus cirricatena]MCC2130097.1 ssDNA-binding domain-containing protein [Brotocaccenecus cirricatena]